MGARGDWLVSGPPLGTHHAPSVWVLCLLSTPSRLHPITPLSTEAVFRQGSNVPIAKRSTPALLTQPPRHRSRHKAFLVCGECLLVGCECFRRCEPGGRRHLEHLSRRNVPCGKNARPAMGGALAFQPRGHNLFMRLASLVAVWSHLACGSRNPGWAPLEC